MIDLGLDSDDSDDRNVCLLNDFHCNFFFSIEEVANFNSNQLKGRKREKEREKERKLLRNQGRIKFQTNRITSYGTVTHLNAHFSS